MSASVRIFFHSGIVTAKVAAGTKYATDSVGLLKQPYLSRGSVTVDTGTAQSVTASDGSTAIAFVQVQAGKSVHMEVNPANRSTSADTGSPLYSGEFTVECGPSWSLSFIEATIS